MKKKAISFLLNGTSLFPLLTLFLIIIPLAVFINPGIVPRYLGNSPITTEFGYLDLEHYISIANNGYQTKWLTAFYPLWPFCIRLANSFFQADIYRIAILLSTFLGLMSIYFSKNVFSRIALQQSYASISTWIYTLSPMTIFFFVGYSEALFSLESWILIGFMIDILHTNNKEKSSIKIKYFQIFVTCILIGLTRSTIAQTIFSCVGSFLIILIIDKQININVVNKYLLLSIVIMLGTCFGYIIYGFLCLSEGHSFLEPFLAQKGWGKEFGIRPIYFFTSRSPLIDYWALYYPFLLIFNNLAEYSIFHNRFELLKKCFSKNLPLTLVYPPIGILYALFSQKNNRRINFLPSQKNIKSHQNEIINSQQLDYLFWYTSFFALSHSLIVFFTQPYYLNGLARYVFGQPYFYVALSLFISKSQRNILYNPKIFYGITVLISSIFLIKHFIDFGNAKLLT
ncbi:hypothetical protein [Prochlorococcus sp. MIT 1307]|uniref:hypothetical protein n=1 Tax=Prochlorococcus sp. MIT 1307 TaxID=3096219 RepID=UPI002A756490|nr:hypothetical protein [Prochlorococcus sp. MIT 1307]